MRAGRNEERRLLAEQRGRRVLRARFTVGSSPKTSSPTSARAIASRIAGVGRVTVSLRRSTRRIADVLEEVLERIRAVLGEDRLGVNWTPSTASGAAESAGRTPMISPSSEVESPRARPARLAVRSPANGSGSAVERLRQPGVDAVLVVASARLVLPCIRRGAPARPSPPSAAPIAWWPRHTPSIGVLPANCRSRPRDARLGRRARPGRRRCGPGRRPSISSSVIWSLRNTCTLLRPARPKHCTRLYVKLS